MTKSSRVSSANNKSLDSLLIIESDNLQRKGIAVALMDLFADLEMTSEAFDAIKLAANKNFQVIISEYSSDKSEHLESLKILRKLNPHSSIIILNNEPDSEKINLLTELNIYRFFNKPLSLSELLNAVESIKNINSNRYSSKTNN